MSRKSVLMTVAALFFAACGAMPGEESSWRSSESRLQEEWMADRRVPELIDGISSREVPVLPEQAGEFDLALAGRRKPDRYEESGGLDASEIELPLDKLEGKSDLGKAAEKVLVDINPDSWSWLLQDPDGDCLCNLVELSMGTKPDNPDTDGDGWFDGPCNQRRKLVLEWIKANDEQEDAGDDEFYLVVDDVRHPHGDLDDWWDFDDGESRSFNRVVAERVRGVQRNAWLKNARVEGWEDDVETWNTWTVDDLLFYFDVNLGNYTDGQTFTVRRIYDDWDYSVRFRVEIEYFADPQPLSDGDSDGDGIRESAEYATNQVFGGIADPQKKDILVEVDWMPGRKLTTQAKRLVTTRYAQHDLDLVVYRHQLVPADDCLTLGQARDLYRQYFSYRHLDSFRYAVMGQALWNDAAEVSAGDAFFIDDSTWWIDGGVLAQAGTFIHALGHSVGLNQSVFRLIDTVAWLSYDSAMNYTFQATLVDYSSSGSGGDSDDHNDWEDVDAAWALNYSFGLSNFQNDGICD